MDRHRVNYAPMNVKTLSPTGLFNHHFLVFWCPTARRTHFVRWMHRIGEHDRFIIAKMIQ